MARCSAAAARAEHASERSFRGIVTHAPFACCMLLLLPVFHASQLRNLKRREPLRCRRSSSARLPRRRAASHVTRSERRHRKKARRPPAARELGSRSQPSLACKTMALRLAAEGDRRLLRLARQQRKPRRRHSGS
ncbi:hypothetical protein FA09DRAFT_152245 [Tilletiopsis washingtonensis]|uniref:Uncharacterized protein n=1 Tax=Tilletiopsis washingtonensis TaxID=58919 RepID=A0A316Z233_9BASI|nr:hypothetical protein FA09DRAFT_152245 [Tilletiopsis washingtonensis]PWN95154.1 hypothetical protein FA09DRAFT_152245 [Tilletiopsis washingtonensis]